MDTTKKQQSSKVQSGTMTAKFDANNDYSKSGAATSQNTQQSTSSKQASSKAQYGTLTAKSDANNEYE